MVVITGGSQHPLSCVLSHFGMVTNKLTNEQPDDPSANLLLTSEKAVFFQKKPVGSTACYEMMNFKVISVDA